jgi:hypothetical protein
MICLVYTHTHTKSEYGLQTPKNPLVFSLCFIALVATTYWLHCSILKLLILATSIKTQFCIAKLEAKVSQIYFKPVQHIHKLDTKTGATST